MFKLSEKVKEVEDNIRRLNFEIDEKTDKLRQLKKFHSELTGKIWDEKYGRSSVRTVRDFINTCRLEFIMIIIFKVCWNV
jgi:uncharacterized coiled-coil DUF342 family protein